MPTTNIGRQVGVPGGSVFAASTLTQQQEMALQQFIQGLQGSGANAATFEPGFGVSPSSLESTSLEALEQRALSLEQPSPLDSAVEQALMQALSGQSTDVSNYFETSIQNPALRSFQEDVLPSIGRSFGGADFFSSERQGADNQARRELVDSLTRSRSTLEFQARESAADRALQAAGLATNRDQAKLQEATTLYEAGREATASKVAQRDKEYSEFVRQQEEKSTKRQQLLGAINTQAQENIVAQKGSSSKGASTAAAIGAIGTIAAAFISDKNKKEDIKDSAPVLDAIEKLPIKKWKYKDDPKGKTHIGPMAQDFKKAFGVGDGKTIDAIDYLGVIMKGFQELAQERR